MDSSLTLGDFSHLSHGQRPCSRHPRQPLAFQRHRLLGTLHPSKFHPGGQQSELEGGLESIHHSIIAGRVPAPGDTGLERKIQSPFFVRAHMPGINFLHVSVFALRAASALELAVFSCSMSLHDSPSSPPLSFVWQLEFTFFFFFFLFGHAAWHKGS